MTDRDLSSLLERATATLPEPDLVEVSWAGALARRRRRRRLVAGTVAAVSAIALATTAALQLGGDADRAVPHPAGPTDSPSERAMARTPDGTVVVAGPRAEEEAGLPVLVAGLPEVIHLGEPSVGLSALSQQQRSSGMVAAYLRPQGDLHRPVLVLADGTHVDIGLSLGPTTDSQGNEAPPLDRAGIVKAGKAIAFPQRGEVVIFTLRDGHTRRIHVPDQTLQWVGWTASGTGLIAGSDTGAWHVDLGTGKATQLAKGAAPERYGLQFSPGVGRLSTWSQAGRLVSDERFGAPVRESHANTFASASGWAATAVFLVQGTPGLPGGVDQGLIAVRVDDTAERRVLAFGGIGQGRSKGCCVPLGWRGDTLLYQSSSALGAWILAWDLSTDTVSRVARVTSSLPDGAPPSVVLAPG